MQLYEHQLKAASKLSNGNILRGTVGSGKSITALYYYFHHVCGGIYEDKKFKSMTKPKDLYIITTAKKRDGYEWDKDMSYFLLSRNTDISGVKVIVDSWNNIKKYSGITNAMFIFDEQKLVGKGVWVKTFLSIAKKNHWILLTDTPGDTWEDYIPVFIANGFYKNRREFQVRHIVYSPFTKYPKIMRYLEVSRLIKLRDHITVTMKFQREIERNWIDIKVDYDKDILDKVIKDRWNVYDNSPIINISQLYHIMRKVVNSDISRIIKAEEIIKDNPKIIVFYNFNFELDILRKICEDLNKPYSEWNGSKHEEILKTNEWVYLVNYGSGAEGWNCINTNVILFYSLNYSYRIQHQSAGRIDRITSKFDNLYYYRLISDSYIDNAIKKALRKKTNFNIMTLKIFNSREKHML